MDGLKRPLPSGMSPVIIVKDTLSCKADASCRWKAWDVSLRSPSGVSAEYAIEIVAIARAMRNISIFVG